MNLKINYNKRFTSLPNESFMKQNYGHKVKEHICMAGPSI
jgi:hypothetical protein